MKPPRLLKPGDVVEVEVDRVGRLSNPVAVPDWPRGPASMTVPGYRSAGPLSFRLVRPLCATAA
jgi:hypothetical protein